MIPVSSLCDRCAQVCFNPTTLETDRQPVRTLRVCHACFEDAVRRSNGFIETTVDGSEIVILNGADRGAPSSMNALRAALDAHHLGVMLPGGTCAICDTLRADLGSEP